jgi:hypothetical protein
MAPKKTKRDQERMVRGTIIELRRKCGKARCRCADGEPHVSWALSYSLQGRTKILTIQPEELAQLRRDLTRYQEAAEALERQAMAGIEAWRRRRS